MLTLKIPYAAEPLTLARLSSLRKAQTSVQMIAFNWLRKTSQPSEESFIEHSKTLNGISLCDGLLRLAYRKAAELHGAVDRFPVIFGGKRLWHLFVTGKLTKDEWKQKRILPLSSCGSADKRGNDHVAFDAVNHKVYLTLSEDDQLELDIPRAKSSVWHELEFIQSCALEGHLAFDVEIDDKNITVKYEPEKQPIADLSHNRVFAVDSTHEHIGWSVLEFKEGKHEVVDAGLFDVSKLGDGDKFEYEIFQIAKTLFNTAKHYKCFRFAVRDLGNLKNAIGKGCSYHKLANDRWLRKRFLQSLKKRCDMVGIDFAEVNPAYCGIVGNVLNNFPDAIACSIEVGRRGFRKSVIGWLLPELPSVDDLSYRWKEIQGHSFATWHELSKALKTAHLKYRRPLDLSRFKVWRFCSIKSNIESYRLTWPDSGKEPLGYYQ